MQRAGPCRPPAGRGQRLRAHKVLRGLPNPDRQGCKHSCTINVVADCQGDKQYVLLSAVPTWKTGIKVKLAWKLASIRGLQLACFQSSHFAGLPVQQYCKCNHADAGQPFLA